MNEEKLLKLQAQVRIGGKGTPRRKKKVVHVTAATDDKKLQSSLKKLSANSLPGIEEVNMFKDDGSVIHFNNPKVQAAPNSNTFAVTGYAENRQIMELLRMPGFHHQVGVKLLKQLASSNPRNTFAPTANVSEYDDDYVPDLKVNFDEACKSNERPAIDIDMVD